MRIAVTYENGQIFQHFGRTEQFKVYDVQEGKIIDSKIVVVSVEAPRQLWQQQILSFMEECPEMQTMQPPLFLREILYIIQT